MKASSEPKFRDGIIAGKISINLKDNYVTLSITYNY